MQAVLLAAGRSSRFWPLNTRHKALFSICGRSLLARAVDGLAAAGIDDVIIVQGPDRAIEDALEDVDADVSFVVQDEPRGMGDALRQAQDLVDEAFIVASGYRADIRQLLDALPDGGDGGVVGSETQHPERYGMLAVDGDRATGIVEKPAGEPPSPYRVHSTYQLSPGFFDALDAVEAHEYDFEDALDRYMETHDVRFAALDEPLPSLKYPWDAFAFADRIFAEQERRIADGADVAESAVIDGNVVIADGATVYEHATVRGPAYLGQDCVVGNAAVVRAGTSLGRDSTVGAHAEVRGSLIQPGFSCHRGFIGDSVIGRDVAVGAGTVVANRLPAADGERPDISVERDGDVVETGRDRLGACIGDGVDIGTQANLMPGTCIGPRSFIGPSTLVTDSVPADTTCYDAREQVETDR